MNKVTYIVIAIAVVAILITIFSARMAIKNAQVANGTTTPKVDDPIVDPAVETLVDDTESML